MAVTGNIGDAEVRLENAAEEVTMQKILSALGGIQDVAGKGNTGLGGLITKTGPLSIALGAVTGGFSLLGKAISGTVKVMGTLVKAGNAVIGFSAGLAQTQMEVTDFTQKLADSKLNILGFGDTINVITKLLYANYTTFQQLSTSGIAFGDRLESMTRDGASVGISLDVLAGNLTANSEAFARLGTGTRGASMAIALAEQAYNSNARTLQTYGLSFAEQNENFLKFFAQNSIALQRGTMTQSQLVNMSDDYAKGLRRLSELTGIQADQLQEGVEKANMNAAFENFISQFDGETQNRLRSVINTMQAGFGDAGREAAMAMMIGVNPVTEGAQQLTSMMPGFGGMLTGLTNSARGFNGSLEEFNNSMYGQMNQFANANRGFADANSRYFATLGLMGDPYGQAGGEIVRFVNMFGGSVDQLSSRLGRESPTQRAFNAFNEAIRDVRLALAELFEKVFKSGAFTNAMHWLSGSGGRSTGFPYLADNLDRYIAMVSDASKREGPFGKFLDRVDTVRAGLVSFGTWISQYNPFTEEGRTNMLQSWRELVANMLIAFNDTFIGGMLTDNDSVANAVQNSLSDVEKALVDRVVAGEADPSEITNRRVLEAVETALANARRLNAESINSEIQGSGFMGGDPAAMRAFRQENTRLTQVRRALPNADSLPFLGEKMFGTLGTIGRNTEPTTGLAKIHAGERVLSPTETAAFNAMETTPAPSGNMNNNLVQKLLDEAKENRVQLVNALNTLHQDMRELQRRQDNTITAIENYA